MNKHSIAVYLQILSICFCCLLALILARTSDELRIKLPNGSKLIGRTLRSYSGRSIKSFLGVPYAKPPLGDLRFKVRDFTYIFFVKSTNFIIIRCGLFICFKMMK